MTLLHAGLVAAALAGPVGEGAAAFAEGDLDGAVEAFEEGMGPMPSGALLYNLGTAWYRRGDPARAVGYLRAAQRLRPRDGSVHHNLALARSELSSVPTPVEPTVSWAMVVTPGELGLLGVLGAGLGSLLLVVGVRREGLSIPGGVALVLGVIVAGTAVAGGVDQGWHPIGVVVDRAVGLRDTASLEGRARAKLPVGAEVQVERSYGAFLLVEDGRGRRGWVPRASLLVPGASPDAAPRG